jgi:hypothetical protein
MLVAMPAMAQRPQFSPSVPVDSYGGSGLPPAGGARLGTPAFDPYASGPSSYGSSLGAPSLTPPPQYGAAPYGNSALGGPSGLAPASPWSTGAPPANAYGGYQGGLGASQGYPAGPAYGNAYGGPYQGNSLFPNGVFGAQEGGPFEALRMFQGPRGSNTYLLGGNNVKDIGIHNFEFAVTGAVPNFLFTEQPLYLTPTFALHLWDGPLSQPPIELADLPGSAYSAFLDTFWASNPENILGAEVGVSVGVYSDFKTFTANSFRVRGEGFGVLRLTPTLTAKLGVWYLNRNDLKLLPAGGLVWQPDEFTKVDILFPNPKFSRYLTTWSNTDMWWYIAGEYGGGAWTIERAAGYTDQVDLNDIRIKGGIDWMTYRNIRGFAEVGYVFNRDVVYVIDPNQSFKARDTVMFALGIAL